ncbi:hypothetical protein ACWKSP_16545 [Micromonosporaceae bacterium Da 78-11]
MRSTVEGMRWTHDGMIRQALWVGGGQWAGKTTVSGLLADRYGLIHYHYDFHASRGHEDRRLAARIRRGEPPDDTDWAAYWTQADPAAMAEQALAGFPETFGFVLDDLRGMVTHHPVVVDAWGARPELVAEVTGDLRRMVLLVPTDGWRRHQAQQLPRARRVGAQVSDPDLAQRNRLERDRLIAADAVRQARALGVTVIEVDGSRDAEAVADEVAAQFELFLTARPGAGPAAD